MCHTSRDVTIPARLPSAPTTGNPATPRSSMIRSNSRSATSGRTVNGFSITVFSDRFTRATCSACFAIDRFRCTTPSPPSRASAIASSASVTVSIADEITGMFNLNPLASVVPMSVSLGSTSLSCGTSSTSSKLRPRGIASFIA